MYVKKLEKIKIEFINIRLISFINLINLINLIIFISLIILIYLIVFISQINNTLDCLIKIQISKIHLTYLEIYLKNSVKNLDFYLKSINIISIIESALTVIIQTMIIRNAFINII